MKIGVISDTHIPIQAQGIQTSILKKFKELDLILHAGDLVDTDTLSCLKDIKETVAVCGNMDSLEIRKQLKTKQIITIDKFKIGLIHGWGHPKNLIDIVRDAFKNESVDIIVFGHSHQPYNGIIDDILFFNPGSPTDKVFCPYNSYGIIEITDTIKGEIIKI